MKGVFSIKGFWISLGILVALSLTLIWNTQTLTNYVTPLQEKLVEAERLVSQEDDWQGAIALTEEVYKSWDEHKTYLQISLPHAQIEDIFSILQESLAYLKYEKIGEYSATNERLLFEMGLIYEMETLSIRNIL